MATLWQDVIDGGMGFAQTMLGDFMPVIVVGVGLGVLAALWSAFSKRG